MNFYLEEYDVGELPTKHEWKIAKLKWISKSMEIRCRSSWKGVHEFLSRGV
jgi:hypothetical protein